MWFEQVARLESDLSSRTKSIVAVDNLRILENEESPEHRRFLSAVFADRW